MAVVVVTTDANYRLMPLDVFVTNNSSPLIVNSKGPFTVHFAIWPFFGLIFLMVTVWFLVYISTMLSRHHSKKTEQRDFVSFYVTQNNTVTGTYEASNVISSADV